MRPTQRFTHRVTDLPQPKLGKWIERQRLNTPGASPVPRYRRHDAQRPGWGPPRSCGCSEEGMRFCVIIWAISGAPSPAR